MATPDVIKRKWTMTRNLFRWLLCLSQPLRHFLSRAIKWKLRLSDCSVSSRIGLIPFTNLFIGGEVYKIVRLETVTSEVQREEIWTTTCPQPRLVTCYWLQTRSAVVTSGLWLWLTREFPTRSSYFTEIRLGFGRNLVHSFVWNPVLLQITTTTRSP